MGTVAAGERVTEEPIDDPIFEPMDPAAAIRGAYEVMRESRQQDAQPASAPAIAATTQQPSRSRVLYRIVHQSAPALSDFTSNLAKCLPMRGAETKEPLLWSGLSMFDTTTAAASNAQRYGGRIGRFLAEVQLPAASDPRVLVRQTLRPGHFTVLCCDTTCMSFVGDVQPIVGLSG